MKDNLKFLNMCDAGKKLRKSKVYTILRIRRRFQKCSKLEDRPEKRT